MKKKIKKRRSVNKSQLEMNVQPIYEQLKKKKKKESWKDNQDGEQQEVSRAEGRYSFKNEDKYKVYLFNFRDSIGFH